MTRARRRGRAVLAALAVALIAAPAAARSVAITIDDLPMSEEGFDLASAQHDTERLLSVLKRRHVRAIGFVNEDKLEVDGEVEARTALLRRWLEMGMDLGDHGYDHLSFQVTPLEVYEAAALKGETVTRALLAARGARPRYYRYPFNETGPTVAARDAFKRFLTAHGYAVAPVTLQDDDYMFADVYADDIHRGDRAEAARVRAAYLAHLDETIDAAEAMSRSLFHRQIPQVLLIHANRLNADTLEETLSVLARRGYRFVPLKTALKDRAYASPDGYAGPQGMSWYERWALGLKRAVSPEGEPDAADWVRARYEALGGH